MNIWWYFNKKESLKSVKYDLLRLSSKRLLASTIVIAIIQHVIDIDRENILKSIKDVQFNPLNDSPLILHLLENYHLLKPYPIHRYHIKRVLKSSVF
jgi:hypothetical protein